MTQELPSSGKGDNYARATGPNLSKGQWKPICHHPPPRLYISRTLRSDPFSAGPRRGSPPQGADKRGWGSRGKAWGLHRGVVSPANGDSCRVRVHACTCTPTTTHYTLTPNRTPLPRRFPAPLLRVSRFPERGVQPPKKNEGLAPTLAAPEVSTAGTRRAGGTGRRGPARGKSRAQPSG